MKRDLFLPAPPHLLRDSMISNGVLFTAGLAVLSLAALLIALPWYGVSGAAVAWTSFFLAAICLSGATAVRMPTAQEFLETAFAVFIVADAIIGALAICWPGYAAGSPRGMF